jgi:hypothetical protein
VPADPRGEPGEPTSPFPGERLEKTGRADSAFIAELLGFAPPGLIGLATDFGLGETLVAGKIASHPAVMRFGSRVASDGGGDVDAGWARRA